MNKNSGNRKKTIIIAICVLIAVCLLWLQPWKNKTDEQPSPELKPEDVGSVGNTGAETGKTGEEISSGEAGTAEEASAGLTAAETAEEDSSILSPEMTALKERLEKKLSEKDGKWAVYLYRLDTGEEFGVNAQDSMISASLIKLYIAGCYFEQIEKGVIEDDYPNQLFTMLSQSNNDSTNQLIDVLGMDTINEFARAHGYEASRLNRRMLEKNGQENYTSAEECGRVLRETYEGTYVNKEASERIMEALRAQIERNRYKIPAGVPEYIETANKTGELYTKDENGANVLIENDAAIIFVPDHPYILTVMTAVYPVGEAEIFSQIAELSAEVYEAVADSASGSGSTLSEEGAAENAEEGNMESEEGAAGLTEEEGAESEEEITEEGTTESVREDAAGSLPEKAAGK